MAITVIYIYYSKQLTALPISGWNFNVHDQDSQKPLHLIITIVMSSIKMRAVEMLVTHGADASAVDSYSGNVLMRAVITGRDMVITPLRST